MHFVVSKEENIFKILIVATLGTAKYIASFFMMNLFIYIEHDNGIAIFSAWTSLCEKMRISKVLYQIIWR